MGEWVSVSGYGMAEEEGKVYIVLFVYKNVSVHNIIQSFIVQHNTIQYGIIQ